MKKLLNTLFVTTQGAYLSKTGETVEVRHEKQTKLQLPIHTLGGIICFGNVTCSPFLMGLCGEHQVTVSFLTEYGRFLARVHGPVNGNVLLRKEQYRRSDDVTASAEIARPVIMAKIANSRVVLHRALRDRPQAEHNADLQNALNQLGHYLEVLKMPGPLDALRGIEGMAANLYFDHFDHLITVNKAAFTFTQRSRRPPLDNVNALLSFLYTLLMHDVTAALESVGLDPAVGFLHRDRPGRPSLALDLMEEFRSVMADRLALSLINRQQIKPEGFRTTESGAVRMNDETRKELLIAYQKRKQEEILHPFLNEKIAVGLIPHVQALLLARHLRGDLDGYPPFFWK
jgi:CRISPR-associated protein Cas1